MSMSGSDIEQIAIKLKSNTGEPVVDLTSGLLVGLTGIRKVEDYPYISTATLIPLSEFEYMSMEQIVGIFFSLENYTQLVGKVKASATKVLPKIKSSYSSIPTLIPDTRILEENVVTMLRALFPTIPVAHNVSDSFGDYPSRISIEVVKNRYSYLKLGSQVYTVNEVRLLNDVRNHPDYIDFAKRYDGYIKWKASEQNRIQDEIAQLDSNIQSRMDTELKNSKIQKGLEDYKNRIEDFLGNTSYWKRTNENIAPDKQALIELDYYIEKLLTITARGGGEILGGTHESYLKRLKQAELDIDSLIQATTFNNNPDNPPLPPPPSTRLTKRMLRSNRSSEQNHISTVMKGNNAFITAVNRIIRTIFPNTKDINNRDEIEGSKKEITDLHVKVVKLVDELHDLSKESNIDHKKANTKQKSIIKFQKDLMAKISHFITQTQDIVVDEQKEIKEAKDKHEEEMREAEKKRKDEKEEAEKNRKAEVEEEKKTREALLDKENQLKKEREKERETEEDNRDKALRIKSKDKIDSLDKYSVDFILGLGQAYETSHKLLKSRMASADTFIQEIVKLNQSRIDLEKRATYLVSHVSIITDSSKQYDDKSVKDLMKSVDILRNMINDRLNKSNVRFDENTLKLIFDRTRDYTTANNKEHKTGISYNRTGDPKLSMIAMIGCIRGMVNEKNEKDINDCDFKGKNAANQWIQPLTWNGQVQFKPLIELKSQGGSKTRKCRKIRKRRTIKKYV